MRTLLYLLPDEHAKQVTNEMMAAVEEIRLCAGQPLLLRSGDLEQVIWPKVSQLQLEQALQKACRHSIYSHADTLRQGYVTVEGGHRIGICGFGVMGEHGIQALRTPSSLLIRVAREFPGCADGIWDNISDSVLILGPPCTGKTTLLRDMIRQLSDRYRQRVGLADVRGEISASMHGVPQLKVGMRTDTMLNLSKAEAVLMLLRTMNPQWIAMDEITDPRDLQALDRCSNCGVKLLATAHGSSVQDLKQRPLYRSLLESGVFHWIILMQRDKSYTIQEVQP